MIKSIKCYNSIIDLNQKLFSEKRKWTLMFWLYLNSGNRYEDISLITQSPNTSYGRYTFVYSSGKLYAWETNPSGSYHLVQENIELKKWYHVTIINENGNYSYYINGDFKLKLENIKISQEDNTIMCDYRMNYQHVDGNISELKIYDNCIMDNSEIKKYMYKKDKHNSKLTNYYDFSNIICNKIKDNKGKIDIDVENFLSLDNNIPSNITNDYKILIKNNSEFYSINKEYYKNNIFVPIKNKNINEIKHLGFYFEDLFKIITIDNDSFTPIDKFIKMCNSNYDIICIEDI